MKSQINDILVHLREGLGLLVEYAGVFGFDVINLLKAELVNFHKLERQPVRLALASILKHR